MKRKKHRRRGQVIERGAEVFLIRVPLGRRGGIRKFHTETFHGPATEAEKRCTKILSEVDGGTFFEPSSTLFSKFIAEWLDQKRRDGARRITLQTYGDIIKLYLAPRLGDLALSEITPTDVQSLYNHWQDRELSAATMRLARAVLKMAFKRAVALRLLRESPSAEIRLPAGREAREGRAFTVAEALRFVAVAARQPADIIYIFDLVTGLRPEELSGLRRSDISFEDGRGVARVRQVAVRIKKEGWVFTPPKTKRGRRDAYFPAHVYHALVEHLTAVDARRAMMGARWQDNDLVFPAGDGRPFHSCGRFAVRFRELLKEAGLPTAEFTPYSLRYSFATLTLLSGETDKAISNQMGHARTDFTKDVYVKVLPEMKQSLSDRFENLLFGGGCTQDAHTESEQVM